MGKSIKDAFKNIIWFKFKAMYGKIVVSWFVFEVTFISVAKKVQQKVNVNSLLV
jgi:hypothetical protein